MRSGSLPLLASLTAALGSLFLGYNLASTNAAMRPVAIHLGWCEEELLSWMDPDQGCPAYVDCSQVNSYMPFITSASLLSGTVAAWSSSFLVLKGRRFALMIAFSMSIVGTIVCTASVSFAMLLIARYIIGAAMGFSSYMVVCYISEIAPAKIRGTLAMTAEFGVGFGQLFATVLSLGFEGSPNLPKEHSAICGESQSSYDREECHPGETDGERFCRFEQSSFDAFWWRFVVAGTMLPFVLVALVLFLFVFRFETPYFLTWKNKDEEAHATLVKLRGHDDIDDELEDLNVLLDEQKRTEALHGKLGFIDFHKKKYSRLAVWTGMFVGVSQPLTGSTATAAMSSFLFLEAGLTEQMATRAGVLVQIMKVAFMIMAAILIDRWGRRNLLLFGATVQFISLLPGAIACLIDHTSVWATRLTLTGCLVFQIGFSCGFGPITYTYIFEMFPPEMRATGTRVSVGVSWLGNVLVYFLAPIMSITTTFTLYCAASFVAIILTHLMVRETKGMVLGTSPYSDFHEPKPIVIDEESASSVDSETETEGEELSDNDAKRLPSSSASSASNV